MRFRLLGLVAATALITSCADLGKTVGAVVDVAKNPLVQAIVKAILPSVPVLNDPLVKNLVSKTFTAAELVSAYTSAFGSKVGDLPRENQIDSLTVQGLTGFGVLTEEKLGLGAFPPGLELEHIILLIRELFDIPNPDPEAKKILPPVYSAKDRSQPVPAPTTGPSPAPDGIVPAQVDLRPKFGPVRHQGQRGTCNIFGACQLLDYYYPEHGDHSANVLTWLDHLQIKSKTFKSEQWVSDGARTMELVPLVTPQGNPIPSTYLPYVPPQQGVPAESVSPYFKSVKHFASGTAPSQVAPEWLGGDFASKLSGGATVPADLLQLYALEVDLETFRAALAGGSPIWLALPCDRDNWGYQQLKDRNYFIRRTSGSGIGFHSIVLVGYQDAPDIEGGGYFILRNQWGTDWGDRGYAKVPYAIVMDYASMPMIGKRVEGDNKATFTATIPADKN